MELSASRAEKIMEDGGKFLHKLATSLHHLNEHSARPQLLLKSICQGYFVPYKKMLKVSVEGLPDGWSNCYDYFMSETCTRIILIQTILGRRTNEWLQRYSGTNNFEKALESHDFCAAILNTSMDNKALIYDNLKQHPGFLEATCASGLATDIIDGEIHDQFRIGRGNIWLCKRCGSLTINGSDQYVGNCPDEDCAGSVAGSARAIRKVYLGMSYEVVEEWVQDATTKQWKRD